MIIQTRLRQYLSHLRALSISAAILALALSGMWLSQELKKINQKPLIIRPLNLATPPPSPPPPPAPTSVPKAHTALQLNIAGNGPVLNLTETSTVTANIPKPEVPSISNSAIVWQAPSINLETFELNELDNMPTLLTPLGIKMPDSLTRKGITEVIVAVDIMVDADGKVELLDISQNPHPELAPEIINLMRKTRFTPPKKLGESVRVKFNWPIKIRR